MSIYVSKKIDDLDFLKFIREKNLELLAIPMISFKPVVFKIPKKEEYDAVFFTSPRSVLFFLEKVELTDNIYIGAIGKSTARFIHQQGYSVHFTGIHSGKPKEVAESFKAAVGDQKVLFPQSSRSKKSIQKHLKPEQCLDLVVYETQLEPSQLRASPEILVFTSPSNVESFLLKNKIDASQKIIAWGDSTALYLEEKGCSSVKILEKSNLEELKTTLQKILG